MNGRRVLLQRLKADLVGPSYGEHEEIDDRPTDRYLTGILFPQDLVVADQEDEEIEEVQSGKSTDTDAGRTDNVSISRTMRPSTAGISFAVARLDGAPPTISIEVSAGTYTKIENNDEIEAGKSEADAQPEDLIEEPIVSEDDTSNGSQPKRKVRWYWLRDNNFCSRIVTLTDAIQEVDLGIEDEEGSGAISGIGLFIKTMKLDGKVTVTVQAINQYKNDDSSTIDEREQLSFCQFEMHITPVDPTELVSRPVRNVASDDDSKTSALIYRDAIEYATGHTCSANWEFEKDGKVNVLKTVWMPEKIVKSVDPSGDAIFNETFASRGLEPPTAQQLGVADSSALEATLNALTDAYAEWLNEEATKVHSLGTEELCTQAEKHLERCDEALARMRFGASLIINDDQVRRAFQSANVAMQIQAAWGRGVPSGAPDSAVSVLTWHPFQLGFALMCIRSFQDRGHDDRSVLDLIWFPTGGGKTEAYLLVASFIMFYRRLVDLEKTHCYGTAVMMRYTLRTLTVQQFQRAAALVCACEEVRNNDQNGDGLWGDVAFSIGLWVGEATTPNKSKTALSVLGTDSASTPCQIQMCPACREDLVWEPSDDGSRVICRCDNEGCSLAGWKELPILTVDDQIYMHPPTMLIGTVDKFAQIVRRSDVGVLFGRGTDYGPPDLIIQDELHLISGPLGTLAGIYETAIDHLCTEDEIRPKVIGSTATIRRAEQQVMGLFQRRAFQFPPPVIDGENSGFAKIDEGSAGRLYVGITTAGRTDKYMLQAVCASLLQAVLDTTISDEERDPYGTLVAYFNSLRILGGALVAMQDDVTKSIGAISRRRGEKPRRLSEPEEMTSRKASSEIPKVLGQLNIPFGQPGSIDTLLASNMLSVGVDIPRLGLMVVNGQPKTMSEYIQATSRVGRQRVPGLIVTIYNNNKPRDRAHYETFETWHSSLYRSIEATSVTPFASRARDKALHSALVALARHLLPSFSDPTLTPEKRIELEQEVLPVLRSRIRTIDERELAAAEKQLATLLDEWEDRGKLKSYWNDFAFRNSLLISAETAAARKTSGLSETAAWETPNSMRNVEPGVEFQLWESAELDRD